jgi:PAS domain S-box-containing protein
MDLTSAYISVSFISALLAAQHAYIGIQRRYDWLNLSFATVAILLACGSFTDAFMYRASSADAYLAWRSWSDSWFLLYPAALLWFAGIYTRGLPRPYILSVVSLLVGLTVIHLIMPAPGLWISGLSEFRTTILPWGEAVADPDLIPRSTVVFGPFLHVLFEAAIIFGCWRQYRRGEQRKALILAGAMTFLIASNWYDMLLVDSIWDAPFYIAEFGFLALLLVMSFHLANEVIQVSVLNNKLRTGEQRWSNLLEKVQLLVAGVDSDGRINYVNPYFKTLSGYSDADIIGRNFTSLMPPQAHKKLLHLFSAVREGRDELPHYQEELVLKDADNKTVSWSNVRLTDSDDRFCGTLSIGSDITRQLQAQHKLEVALLDVETLKRRLEEQVVYLQEEIRATHNFEEMVGESDEFKYVLYKIEQVAPLDTTILIEGETGTGKELVARAVHHLSSRKDRPLVMVNCAALPENLIEAELFGHEKGAYTGAVNSRKGRFELADGGTLFLDEIGELPLELQVKLLRTLQEKEIQRLGGQKSQKVDVRIIAATNRNLTNEVEQGRFRNDLFYRLNVYQITVPPLRKRQSDIPLLVQRFIEQFAEKQGKQIEKVPQAVMDQLLAYHWPGNIRELQNVIERAVIITPGDTLRLAEILVKQDLSLESIHQINGTLQEVEKGHILRTLEHTNWRIEGDNGASKILGVAPSTLRARMRKLGIKRLTA